MCCLLRLSGALDGGKSLQFSTTIHHRKLWRNFFQQEIMFEGVEENQLLGWKLPNKFNFTGKIGQDLNV